MVLKYSALKCIVIEPECLKAKQELATDDCFMQTFIQLQAVDHSARGSMKNAASCVN